MNIVFKKMYIDNFLSFDKEVFDFESNKGIILITGTNNDIPGSKNGTGKSSLCSAFVFALFGKMLNQMSIKNVPNRYLPLRNTEVALEMTVDDVTYTVIGGIKAQYKTSYCKLYKSDYASISKDNELTKHSVKETRKFIEKNILRTNFDVFLRSFVLTSDQFYNFFKMSKQEKRLFIENIFDLRIFGEMYRNIHKDKLENDKRLDTFDALVASNINDIQDISNRFKDVEQNKNRELENIRKQIEETKTVIHKKEQALSKYNIVKMKDKLQGLHSESDEIRHKQHKLQSEIDSKKRLVTQLKKQYAEKVDYIKNYIETWNNLSDFSKPVVNEKLGIEQVKNSIKELSIDIKKHVYNIKELIEHKKTYVVPSNLSENIDKLEKIVDRLKRIELEIKQHQRDIQRLKNQFKKTESNPGTIKELLDKKQKDYDNNKEKLDEYVNTKNLLSFIENVVGEENIRRLIVSDLIKMLNSQIQTYLSSMGADFTCMFDKDFNYMFLTKNGETEYSSFSSGEKMRLNIAINFGFRDFIMNRSGINCNVLILDEYIDANLDDLAVNEIFKILREFHILYNQNIFVVSHREAVKLNTFDSVYSVDKTDGISKINKQLGE